MTREEFDYLNSDGKFACPDCGSHRTHPAYGRGCGCIKTGSGTQHINKWHHTCGQGVDLREKETGMKKIPDVITLCNLEVVLMPQGEIICKGKTVGYFRELKEHLSKKEE